MQNIVLSYCFWQYIINSGKLQAQKKNRQGGAAAPSRRFFFIPQFFNV
jgi:hypothetical protein